LPFRAGCIKLSLAAAKYRTGCKPRREIVMTASEISDNTVAHPTPDTSAPSAGWRSRLWPAVALVVVFWVSFTLPRMIEMPIALSFFSGVIASALFTLTFLAWWLFTRSVGRTERTAGLLALFVGAATAVALSQTTLGTIGVLYVGLPVAFTDRKSVV
jgi:hypothetical protein